LTVYDENASRFWGARDLHKGELGTWYCRKHVPPGFPAGTAMPGPPPSLPI